MTYAVDIVLFAFLVTIAIAIARLRSLFAAVMLTGIFSLLSAGLFVAMDAVDVAFTEAAVGVGISTILMLVTLNLTSERETTPVQPSLLPLVVVLITGVALVYATKDMPRYGDPAAPIHHHVADHYLEKSGEEIGIPNVVTSVLASYRGFDTLGETAVIFTAAIGVMMLLFRSRRKPEET
jgi:multicomponent Na+:H+ antiporter subunit B